MLLNGKQKMIRFICSAVFFSITICSAYADFNQFVPNQKGMETLDNYDSQGVSQDKRDNASHVPGTKVRPLDKIESLGQSGHLPGEKEDDPKFMYESTQKGIQGLGTIKTDNYLEFKTKDLLREANGKGKSSFGFSFLKDSFDYDDSLNSFDTIFKEPSGTSQGGFLVLTSEYYFNRRYIDLFATFSGGVGLSYGQGIFIGGAIADSNFRLWKIPLDAGIGIGVPLGPWFSIVGSAGPSVLGLIQNRSDQARGSDKKERRQLSFGYYTQATFRWNLSPIFKEASLNMLREQKVSNFYLNVFARQNNYENFKQEDLIVSGQSIGLGFSFDFL